MVLRRESGSNPPDLVDLIIAGDLGGYCGVDKGYEATFQDKCGELFARGRPSSRTT